MLGLIRNKTAQGLSGWAGLLTTVFTLLGKLTPEWFGALTWPQAILAGIAAALGAMLLFAVALVLGAYGFRLLRPIPVQTPDQANAVANGETPEPLGRQLAEQGEESAKMIDLSSRMASAFEDQMNAIEGDLAARKVEADNHHGRIVELREMQAKIIDDYQRMLVRSDKASEAAAKAEKTFGTIFLAIQAMRALELVTRHSEVIQREGKFLTQRVNNREPVKGDDWRDWQSHKVTFDSALGHWMDLARGWHPTVEEWVNKMNPDDLTDGRWVGLDAQFDGSNAVTSYKVFARKFERWKHFEENVRTVLHIAAYTGPSAAETLSTMYGGGPTIDGASANAKRS